MKVYKKRAAALAAFAYAAPLYMVAQLVHVVRGEQWRSLHRHLNKADDRLGAAEYACVAAGDGDFAEWLGNTADRLTAAVCAVTARLAREPVR